MKQYNQSPIIQQLIADMAEYLDMTRATDAFYDMIWNVDTAQGIGLDIWGRIVVIDRVVKIDNVDYLGFQTGATPEDWLPFNEGVFFSGATATDSYTLPDDAYRLLILTKAFANICATVAPALNKLLQILFAGRGRCYVNDYGDMQMRYTFEFALEPWELTVLTNGTVLPRPAGVLNNILYVPPPIFGFFEAGTPMAPFNEGILFTGALDAA